MGNVGKCTLHGASGFEKHVYSSHGPLHACLFVILHGFLLLGTANIDHIKTSPVESSCVRFVLDKFIDSSTNSDAFLLPRKLTCPLKVGRLILLSF